MHEVRPVSERCILFGLALLGLCVGFYPGELIGSFGVGQAIRLLFSSVFLVAAVTIFISLAVGFPKISWTEINITSKDLFLRKMQLKLADFGLATPYSTYHKGIRTANFLLFRPILGGKIIYINLLCYGYSEAQLAELADRINKTRGMPTGSADAQALVENHNSIGLFIIIFLLFIPAAFLLYIIFTQVIS